MDDKDVEMRLEHVNNSSNPNNPNNPSSQSNIPALEAVY